MVKFEGDVSIKEVVGSFKNGTLHGLGKITLSDKSVIIAHFRNGSYYGFYRKWDPTGTLQIAGYWNVYKQGKTWRRLNDHLVVTDESIVKEEGYDRSSIVIPLNKTNKNEIMSGILMDHMNTLMDPVAVDIELASGHSPDNACLLELITTEDKTNKKDLSGLNLDLTSQFLVPAGTLESNLNCAMVHNKSLTKPEDHFVKWLDNTLIRDGYVDGFKNLFTIKPVSNPVDHDQITDKYQYFISDMAIVDPVFRKYQLYLFGQTEDPATFQMVNGSMDHLGRPQGVCSFLVQEETYHLIPRHPMLKWEPALINGWFEGGKLQGPVRFGTVANNVVWATFKDGILHGPAYGWGITPILDAEVI